MGPPSSAASLPLRLSGGWFARRHLIDPIDLAELLQKLWIAIVQTDDLAELGAVAPFVLHDFAPDRAREILDRVVAALPRGGRVVILEIVPDDERRSPPLAVAFAVAMIVNTAGGDAHTVPQYRAWLEEAGLVDVTVTPIGGRMVTTVLEARKP